VEWRDDPIRAAQRGQNPMVMARMPSGFAVIGESQQLPGYSLLLCDDPDVNHLTDLPRERRVQFLADFALLGEAVTEACRDHGLRRINYEILGNQAACLHAHVHARYEWEPPDLVLRPVWFYEDRLDPAHAYSDERHGALRAAITDALAARLAT